MNHSASSLDAVLKHYHEQLNERLLLQQDALIDKNITLALQLFCQFQLLMTDHLRVENLILLPLHAEIENVRWPSSLYKLEHNKIIKLMSKAELQLRSAQRHKNTDCRRDIVEIIDYQRTLKGVLEHHEAREEQGLLAELTQHLCNETQQQIAHYCHQHWQGLFEIHPVFYKRSLAGC
ncbi:MAG: hypothetical protein KUG80_02500 [Gammaproteobacteria bacterium]|nr:hypothetical protein [Gammaproteobacteria bacterium]